MSIHDRTDLGEAEEGRLVAAADRILAALHQAPRTNQYFADGLGIKDYGRRVRDLRQRGYSIKSKRIEGGLWRYTLLAQPEPSWEVDIKTTLPDGRFFFYTVLVQATNAGRARNVAQHTGLVIKILGVRPKHLSSLYGQIRDAYYAGEYDDAPAWFLTAVAHFLKEPDEELGQTIIEVFEAGSWPE